MRGGRRAGPGGGGRPARGRLGPPAAGHRAGRRPAAGLPGGPGARAGGGRRRRARAAADQAERLGLPRLVRAMEVAGRAQVDMREAPDPRVVLEVALVRLARPELDDSTGRPGRSAEPARAGPGRSPPPAAARNRPPPPGRPRATLAGPEPVHRRPCGGSGPEAAAPSESPAQAEIGTPPPPPGAPPRRPASALSGARPVRRSLPDRDLLRAGLGRPRPAQPAGPGQGALQRRPLPVGGGRGGRSSPCPTSPTATAARRCSRWSRRRSRPISAPGAASACVSTWWCRRRPSGAVAEPADRAAVADAVGPR